MSKYIFREFSFNDADYERCVAIHNAVWPDDHDTVESMKHNDEKRNKQYLNQRWMIETTDPAIQATTDGQAIGCVWTGESDWSYQPGKYHFGFNIDPAIKTVENKTVDDIIYGQGQLAEKIHDFLMDFLNQRDPKPVLLTTNGREDRTEYTQYLEANGFKMVMREAESELEVMEFDPTPFLSSVEKAKANGIQIYSLPELQAMDEDWKPKLYDVDIAALLDVPHPGEFTPRPIEEWEKMFTHPDFLAESWFVAVHDGQYVGVTNLWDNKPNPQKIYVGLTGVRRDYRRKGIATAVKLRAIDYAQKRGCTRMATENEENNPMYQINLRLGFKPTPGWLSYHKEIAA
ncbi:MAG: GNAT family N-acetyltransferase [Chloroflexota bacterium]